MEEDLPAFFLGKLGALIHFSTTWVLKNSSHLKHEIGWMGGNTWDIQEPSKKAMISYLLTKLFQMCEAGPEEEIVLELPMGARSDGAFIRDTKTQKPVKWIAAVCSATCCVYIYIYINNFTFFLT